jgi:hypothetical protein
MVTSGPYMCVLSTPKCPYCSDVSACSFMTSLLCRRPHVPAHFSVFSDTALQCVDRRPCCFPSSLPFGLPWHRSIYTTSSYCPDIFWVELNRVTLQLSVSQSVSQFVRLGLEPLCDRRTGPSSLVDPPLESSSLDTLWSLLVRVWVWITLQLTNSQTVHLGLKSPPVCVCVSAVSMCRPCPVLSPLLLLTSSEYMWLINNAYARVAMETQKTKEVRR